MKGQLTIAAIIMTMIMSAGLAQAKEQYITTTSPISKPLLSGKERLTFDSPIAGRLIRFLEQNNPAQRPRYFGLNKETAVPSKRFSVGSLKRVAIGKEARAWTSLSSSTVYDERITPAEKAKSQFTSTKFNTRYSFLQKQKGKTTTQ